MTRRFSIGGRRALVAVALVAMLATAGCTGVLNSGGDGASGGGGAKLDSVPASAEMVGYVNVDAAMSDDAVRSLANTYIETFMAGDYYEGPSDVSGWMERVENQTGLDPAKVDGVTFFGESTDTSPTAASQAGMVVVTEFTEDELVSSMEDAGTELSKETYQDTTLYTYGYEGGNALAVLGDGTFAVGDTASVESIVDVRAGNADAVGDTLRSAYEDTRDGIVRFAADVPQSQLPAEQIGTGSPVNTSAFNTVETVSGTFYTSGDTVGMETTLTSESEADASRITDVVDGGISLYKGMGNEQIRDALEQVSVAQDGSSVTVTYEDTVQNIQDAVEKLTSGTA